MFSSHPCHTLQVIIKGHFYLLFQEHSGRILDHRLDGPTFSSRPCTYVASCEIFQSAKLCLCSILVVHYHRYLIPTAQAPQITLQALNSHPANRGTERDRNKKWQRWGGEDRKREREKIQTEESKHNLKERERGKPMLTNVCISRKKNFYNTYL